MVNHFTKKGILLQEKLIAIQQQRVKMIGKESGEAAGINCDWHDNFAYEDAKRRLEMESPQLPRLQEGVSNAYLIQVPEQNEKIAIGVTAEIIIDGDVKEFTIGAYGESDPQTGLISYNTPLARGLL